jgi:hypothetical protein
MAANDLFHSTSISTSAPTPSYNDPGTGPVTEPVSPSPDSNGYGGGAYKGYSTLEQGHGHHFTPSSYERGMHTPMTASPV